MKWLDRLRERFRKPKRYRVVFHTQSVSLGNTVKLYECFVYAKTQRDALWVAIGDNIDEHVKKTAAHKWKWWAYEAPEESEN